MRGGAHRSATSRARRMPHSLCGRSSPKRRALGTVLARSGNTQDAERVLESAIRLAPNNAEAYFNLGILQAQRGALTSARSYLLQAARLDGELAMLHYNLGLIAKDLGDYSAAREHFRRQLERTPEMAGARQEMAALKNR